MYYLWKERRRRKQIDVYIQKRSMRIQSPKNEILQNGSNGYEYGYHKLYTGYLEKKPKG